MTIHVTQVPAFFSFNRTHYFSFPVPILERWPRMSPAEPPIKLSPNNVRLFLRNIKVVPRSNIVHKGKQLLESNTYYLHSYVS